jgi:hypothetical protein
MRILIVAFTAIIFASSSIYAQKEYDQKKFKNIKRMQRKLVEVTAFPILRYDVKKAVITECKGTFTNAVFLQDHALKYNNSFEEYIEDNYVRFVDQVEPGSTYFETLSNFVYERVAKIFHDNGIKIVSRDQLINGELYKSYGFNKQSKGVFSGIIKNIPGQSIAPTGMSVLPFINFSMEEPPVAGKLAHIAASYDAQANIRIVYEIEVGKSGNPVVSQFDVYMDSWLSSYKKGDKSVYKWKDQNTKLFTLKEPVTGTSAENGFNAQEFDSELTEMLSKIAEMFSYALSDEILDAL